MIQAGAMIHQHISHDGMKLVTRNEDAFAGTGVEIVNFWE
jgi:hypothetical protein